LSTHKLVLLAHNALLDSDGKLSYFQERHLSEATAKSAYVGYRNREWFKGYIGAAFTYPCFDKNGELLAAHYKSEARGENGKRHQKWGLYADDLPPKGHGKNPDAPAKVIPFGMETLRSLTAGSLVVMCCGEEDALSLRQIGFTALSQPGAGLLEPVYARELAGFEVVVFYDAGEEQEARKDALKMIEAGAQSVRVVKWPSDTPHGSDINGRLVENAHAFGKWAAEMIGAARPVSEVKVEVTKRAGKPDRYGGASRTGKSTEESSTLRPTLAHEAHYGLAGEVLEAIEPHTEADPVAVLINILIAFGNAAGRGPHVNVGPDRHGLNLNAVIVGKSSKARKGMSSNAVKNLMRSADSFWTEDRVMSGLSTGEGLIYAVRDRVVTENKNGELIVVDEGVSDKRLLAIESEFARPLKLMTREGNILSIIIRQGWDGDTLQTLTRNSPLKATDPHISIIGHTTEQEVLRLLSETDTSNGFANRFLWLLVKRSQALPFGGEWSKVDTAALVKRLSVALQFARNTGEITWGESASKIWESVYEELSEGETGLFGAATSRAEAQALRLSAIYAVMDKSRTIEVDHLLAGLAVWEYAEQSARRIFGDATGDPVADKIMEALKEKPKGLTRNEIRDLFARHRSSTRIDQALNHLQELGRVRSESQATGGRPVERWFAK
jgi:Protein of unknown function (DUF3987)